MDISEDLWDEFSARVILGLHHEQQHQELLLMDIKHNLAVNPLKPAYNSHLVFKPSERNVMKWIDQSGGVTEIGHEGEGFAFDNEKPRHQDLLHDHQIASRLVTNEEYLAFIDDDGYSRPELWLADGWSLIGREGWQHPLYWESIEGEWWQFTLSGMRTLEPHEPVCHLSYYEADAYARWSGKRLPTEAELETILTEVDVEGNLLNHNVLHPKSGSGQWYGDVWEWTSSAYSPYPGFQPLEGSMGEYNGKFMCNQMVLRGGSCVTPQHHMRATYRNFYYPHDRWVFAGLRLAGDL
jgi:ergothioneine biosynthesis protein EgtB